MTSPGRLLRSQLREAGESEAMATQRGLTVRGYERLRVELPVEFVIAPEHRAQVRFSPTSCAAEQFRISGVTFDLSVGGIGFRSPLFLPRHCEGTVRIFSAANVEAVGDESVCRMPRLEHRAKVRRVWMNNAEGNFSVGLAFLGATPALEALIHDMLLEYEASVAGRVGPDEAGERRDA